MPPRSPLYNAFSVLYRVAPPATQDRALRSAIAVLVDTSIAPPRPPVAPGVAPDHWSALRPQLHAIASSSPAGRQEVADGLGVALTTVSRMLGPTAPGPGAAVIARAEAWLAARSLSDDIQSRANEPAQDPRAQRSLPRPAPGGSNGRDPRNVRTGPLSPNRLTRDQCEPLAGHVELDPAGVRRAGVTRELAEKAVAGQALPGKVIERLTAYISRG